MRLSPRSRPNEQPAPKLIFGLQWFALIQGPRSPALKYLLQRHRPRSLCFTGHTFYSVGLHHQALSPGVQSYSAAACVAQSLPEKSHLFLLQDDKNYWWLLAIHEGTVVSGSDRVYENKPDALAHLERLQSTYPQAQCVFQLPAGQSLEAWLRARCSPQATLKPARKPPLLGISLGLLGLLVGFLLWPVPRSPLSAPDPDAVALAQSALHELERSNAVSGVVGLRNLLNTLEQAPLKPGGWQLQKIHCQNVQQQWSCAAQYSRQERDATNLSFEQHVSSDMHIHYESLDSALVNWIQDMGSQPLSAHLLQRRRRNERDLFSQLQSVQSAFTKLAVSASQALPMSPPEQQLHLVHAPEYRLRRWYSQGPLRSHYVILPWVGAFRWEQATLSWRSEPAPNLYNSSLNLTLEGQLYELAEHAQRPPHAAFSYSLADGRTSFTPLFSVRRTGPGSGAGNRDSSGV